MHSYLTIDKGKAILIFTNITPRQISCNVVSGRCLLVLNNFAAYNNILLLNDGI